MVKEKGNAVFCKALRTWICDHYFLQSPLGYEMYLYALWLLVIWAKEIVLFDLSAWLVDLSTVLQNMWPNKCLLPVALFILIKIQCEIKVIKLCKLRTKLMIFLCQTNPKIPCSTAMHNVTDKKKSCINWWKRLENWIFLVCLWCSFSRLPLFVLIWLCGHFNSMLGTTKKNCFGYPIVLCYMYCTRASVLFICPTS